MTTLLRNIGELVTNDPTRGDRYGIVNDAAIEWADGVVTWVGLDSDAQSRENNAREVLDAEGRAVIPGFVDSHTHIAFAGERSLEFAARMAGESYGAGGINTTVAATRAATDDELRQLLQGRINEMRAQGTTTVEIKTGYGLTVEHEVRLARIAREFTDHVTFLGAHVIPIEYLGRTDDYVDVVCGDMLDAVLPFVTAIDVFCEDGAFSVDHSRRILEAGKERGLATHIHAAQLGPSESVRMAVEHDVASVDHGTFLSDADIAELSESDTVVTLLPGADFSTRQPYPDARRLMDAGVTVAIATNCNPGSSYTTSMAFCIAIAVREMGMTPSEALWAATSGGAQSLGVATAGNLAVGSRSHVVELAAPNHIHLAYRPGANLVRRVWS
jgi:imidazolonepropionase